VKNLRDSYLQGKGIGRRTKRVFYSRGWSRVSSKFSYIEAGRQWRRKLADFAKGLGVKTLPDLEEILGKNWFKLWGERIKAVKSDADMEVLIIEGLRYLARNIMLAMTNVGYSDENFTFNIKQAS
jgi:hypothetical protein